VFVPSVKMRVRVDFAGSVRVAVRVNQIRAFEQFGIG
jgi:hypothetical protein